MKEKSIGVGCRVLFFPDLLGLYAEGWVLYFLASEEELDGYRGFDRLERCCTLLDVVRLLRWKKKKKPGGVGHTVCVCLIAVWWWGNWGSRYCSRGITRCQGWMSGVARGWEWLLGLYEFTYSLASLLLVLGGGYWNENFLGKRLYCESGTLQGLD
ncbi:hypothetical protein KY290_007796 [Solanum tuberosum]|uniref:Uncharacterized protein n=1 Tax=Solanum tuberosum TaxID=4113 RepID=A0ABQ7W8R1_SOLTU|nr:hypothetical protein KY290_007796 [Solanum tuberosum]